MQVSPIRKYRGPSIPTHDDVEHRPGLLQHIPTRWQTNPAVLTALASVTMLSATNAAIAGSDKAKAKPARVAPVFHHGEGRGGFGCMAIAPPVCLSEDEARQVINDEVKRSGLKFVAVSRGTSQKPTNPTLDAVDKKHNIAFAFISEDDGVIFTGSTAYESNALAKAKSVAKSLKSTKGTQSIGVFYDPMPSRLVMNNGEVDYNATIDRLEHSRKTGRATAEQQLRLQVQDFVKWLKAQGVI